MSSDNDSNSASRGSLRLAPAYAEVEREKAKLPRQFVNFTFYRARPEWRLLSEDEKQDCKNEFIAAIERSIELNRIAPELRGENSDIVADE